MLWGMRRVYAMVSFPGSLLSLNVCMLMTSSVLTITGGWGFCLRRRWHFRDTRSSSIMALQNERCTGQQEKKEIRAGTKLFVHKEQQKNKSTSQSWLLKNYWIMESLVSIPVCTDIHDTDTGNTTWILWFTLLFKCKEMLHSNACFCHFFSFFLKKIITPGLVS